MDIALWLSRGGLILVLLFLMLAVRRKNWRKLGKKRTKEWEKYWIYDYAGIGLYVCGSIFLAWGLPEAEKTIISLFYGIAIIALGAIIQDKIIRKIIM